MSNQTADVIAYNGKIAPQNEQWSIVEAVAIRDGKFLAVGTDREMMAWRGDQTQLINLNKRTAIPGLDQLFGGDFFANTQFRERTVEHKGGATFGSGRRTRILA